MQDHPGAPGSARQRNTGTDGPAACGGAAVPSPQAWDHVRSRAVPLHTPLAPGHSRPRATPMPMPLPLAPNHHRSGAASMASPGHAGCGPAFAGPSVPLTTAPWPAHASRLLQEVLPRVPATPRRSHLPDSPTPPPITCILPSRCRPARRLPPRARASHANAIRAPRPHPPAENLFSPAMVSPLRRECGFPCRRERRIRRTPPLYMVERGPGGGATPPHV